MENGKNYKTSAMILHKSVHRYIEQIIEIIRQKNYRNTPLSYKQNLFYHKIFVSQHSTMPKLNACKSAGIKTRHGN